MLRLASINASKQLLKLVVNSRVVTFLNFSSRPCCFSKPAGLLLNIELQQSF